MAQDKQPTKYVIVALDHENSDLYAMEFPSKEAALRWRNAKNPPSEDNMPQNQKNIMVNLVGIHPPELEVDYDT